MKQLVVGKFTPLFFLGALIISGATFYFFMREKVRPRIIFSFDTHIAHSVRENIVATIQAHRSEHVASMSKMVHEKFPSIDSVSFHYCSPDALFCHVQGVRPLINVNSHLVVAESGTILPKECFTNRSVAFLYDVRMPKTVALDHVPGTFITTMRKIMPDLFMRYAVSWIDEQEIWLKEKEKEFSIVCNHATLPDEKMLNFYKHIQDDVLASQAEKKGRKQQWAADIRFDHQLILFAGKEGVGYG